MNEEHKSYFVNNPNAENAETPAAPVAETPVQPIVEPAPMPEAQPTAPVVETVAPTFDAQPAPQPIPEVAPVQPVVEPAPMPEAQPTAPAVETVAPTFDAQPAPAPMPEVAPAQPVAGAQPLPTATPAAAAATSESAGSGKPKNKWVALLLCIFTGCGHKFYEGKIGMGFLYLFTGALLGIGWIIDIIKIAKQPETYYV